MIYFIQAGENGPIKIGMALDVYRRLAELQTGHYERLRIIGLIDGERAQEKLTHSALANFRLNKEWFSAAPEVLEFVSRNTYLPPTQKGHERKDGMTEGYFTIAQAASILRKSERTIRRWIDRGEIEANHDSGDWLINKSQLEKFGIKIQNAPA